MATWDLSTMKHHILLCNGSSCNKAGAEELTQAVRSEISKRNLDNVIHTTRTRCNGRCKDRCVLVVYPFGTWYKEMKAEDAPRLIDSLMMESTTKLNKISHQYNGESFERTVNTVEGVKKTVEKIGKVSKVIVSSENESFYKSN